MELYDYQKEGVEFIKQKKKVYIAFDMGMGKTLTALEAHRELDEKHLMIIAEKNEIVNSQNFKKEVEAYFPEFEYISLRDLEIKDLPNKRLVCGVNPDRLAKLDIKEIKEKFGSVIMDEATMAKTTSTIRFKKIRKVCDELEYLTMLSGTPMMNGASEIYAPLLLMGHWLAGDGTAKAKKAFETIFAGGYLKQIRRTGIFWQDWQWWAKGANHVRELRWLIKDCFFFKLKGETSTFKKKTRIVKKIPMSDEWSVEYEKAWDDYFESVKKHNRTAKKEDKKSIKNIKELQALIENGQMYQVNSKWKAREVAKDIANGEYGDKRIIVWSMFIETDKIIQDELTRLGISHRTFDELTEWKVGNEQVLIGRIMSHAKGGNIPQACVSLFVDMNFVPTMNLQAENRPDRPEQENDMLIVYYMTEGENIDEHVQKINIDKMRKIEKFMLPFTEEEKYELPKNVLMLKMKYRKEFQVLKTGFELSTGRFDWTL